MGKSDIPMNGFSMIRACIKVGSACGLLLGVGCGVVYSVGGALIDILVSLGILSGNTMDNPGLSAGTIMAFGALIAMPVIGGFFGIILGFLVGLMIRIKEKFF